MAATHKFCVISMAVNETTGGDTNYKINNNKKSSESNQICKISRRNRRGLTKSKTRV